MRLIDLFEEYTTPRLKPSLKNTLPPTVTVPSLPNSNGYDQYRYLLNMAAAEAAAKGEVVIDQESVFNQSITMVCYAPEEMDIINKTDKLMGVKHNILTASKSKEPNWVNSTSTVRKFIDYK
jgi:hypothetical protein